MNKYVKYIRTKLDERTLLEQLAEESAELTQAVLKLIRAKGLSNNKTPVSRLEAFENYMEEVNDIALVMEILGGNDIDENKYPKLKRWAERLGYKDE